MKNRTASSRSNSGLILARKPRSLPAMRIPTVPITRSLQRRGKPPRRLFIQNEQRGSRLQTQTDDLTFSWANGSAHRAGLERRCQLLDQDPVGQSCYRWLHFPGNGRRNANAGVKPAQQIELANLSKRD